MNLDQGYQRGTRLLLLVSPGSVFSQEEIPSSLSLDEAIQIIAFKVGSFAQHERNDASFEFRIDRGIL